jgi:hypothetical protein
MPEALDDGGSLAVCDDPGKAMRTVADKLGAHGFDVRGPDWEEGRNLTVTGLRDTMCEVTVEDSGFVIWEYRPRDSADPDKVAARVMRLLTDDSPAVPAKWLDRPEPRTALKGLVGRRLEARGMAVCLEVYEDQVAYEVAAEISVTNPGRPERGRVHVTDDGALTWECGYEEHDSDTRAIAGLIAGQGESLMGIAIWCDVKDKGHAFAEREAIIVNLGDDAQYFCQAHCIPAFVTAFHSARTGGQSGIFLPTLGGTFTVTPRDSQPDATAQRAAPPGSSTPLGRTGRGPEPARTGKGQAAAK